MNGVHVNPLKVYVYHCSGSFDSDTLHSNIKSEEGDEFKIIGLPCSGKIDILYLIKSFETGADGVVLLTCPEGSCRYLEGNLRAPRRIEEVNSLLMETGLEGGRVLSISMTEGGITDAVKEIADFCVDLRNMRLNTTVQDITEPAMALR